MGSIQVRPLRDDLPFGSRVAGLTENALQDENVRGELNALFEERGLIIFEDVVPSTRMQVAISTVFGPLKEHPVTSVDLVDPDATPGILDVSTNPETGDIVEIGGERYSNWLPWHFDHCYNNELNRAGVLRAVLIAPKGGLTGFLDGIELYRAIPSELRQKIDEQSVVYSMDMRIGKLRFGRPKSFRLLQEEVAWAPIVEQAKTHPRSIHPAVWTRKSGEKVLHISPWMAEGIENHEDSEGDALLDAVSQEIFRLGQSRAYFHQWKTTDMLIWDNWRMLHSVTGCNPPCPRRIHRTTIKGDYGLGRFENNDQGRYELLERVV